MVLILISISHFVSAQWVRKADALKTRSEFGSVLYNGKLYAFLGFRDSLLNVEPSAEVYDPALNTWKLLASLPLNKSVTHQGIALIDDNVWHIGGRVGKNPGPLTSEIWIYNITNNSWSSGPQIKDPATGNLLLWGAGGAAFLGRTLHVFGGFIINGCNSDQEIYHLTLNVDDWITNPSQPAPWKNDLAPLPIKRNHFGTAVLGGKIYAIGGQFGHDCGGGLDQQYSHVYNPATNKWTELPLLPAPRSHIEGSTFAIDGKIYIVAGQGKYGVNTNKVTIFNPAGNNGAGSWTDSSNLLLPKSYEGLSAKVINSKFLISHGGQGTSRNPQKTTYTRTITRTPVYKLGFPSECLNLNDSLGSSLKGQTWLFTIDSTKSYTTSSNASWLIVSKNATGVANPNAVDIEVTANTAGLAPGIYNATITATGTGSGVNYTAATLCVTLTVQQNIQPDSAVVTNIASTTGRTYTLSNLIVGTTVFTDRTYQATSVPATLNNAPFIKMPNDDKYNTTATLLSFTINQNATVYIAYDPRATVLPSWLSDWQKLTGEQVGINDSKISYMQLYSKNYNAGTVSLGGNLQSPAEGAQNNYFVIVQPQYNLTIITSGNGTVASNPSQATYINGTSVTLTATPSYGQQFTGWSGDTTGNTNPLTITIRKDMVITGNFLPIDSLLISNIIPTSSRSYVLGKLVVGTTVYTDRTYQATSVPASLNNAALIKTPMDDKTNATAKVVSFTVNQNATVYIAFDPRATALPAWLSSFQKLTWQIGVTDPKISYLQLYSKNYSTGTVSLGGNSQYPETGALANYFVVVQPQQVQSRATSNLADNFSESLGANNIERSLMQENRNSTLKLKLYPNPNPGDKLHIEANNFSKHEMVTITLQDALGNIIRSMKIITDYRGTFSENISTRYIGKGLYIINAISISKNLRGEIIIN